jgi:hypothetical protein
MATPRANGLTGEAAAVFYKTSRPRPPNHPTGDPMSDALYIAGIIIAAIILFKVLFPKTGFQG